MINPKELRLGNVVYCGAVKGIVTEICASGVTFDYLDGSAVVQHCEWEHINPVSLSDEDLLKCGFKIGTGEELRESLFDEVFWIEGLYILERIGHEEGFSFYHSNDEDGATFMKWVKHLHKLQNLYFELTGQELEIKLEI